MTGEMREEAKLPNFLIVGAATCGTTSLYNYLKQHLEVYMPLNKEPHFLIWSVLKEIYPNDPYHDFFKKNAIYTIKNYIVLFKNVPEEKVVRVGERLVYKNLEKPKMKPETRESLKELYRDDILKLQDLIDRDLSHWLQ